MFESLTLDHYVLSVQFISVAQLFSKSLATPWNAARQASLSITNSWSLLKLMSIELTDHYSKHLGLEKVNFLNILMK